MDHPPLPADILVLPGTDIEGAWERFYPFEALHHLHEICNPMRRTELSAVLDALGPTNRAHAIDIACGHGDLLLDMAHRVSIVGVGVDLSPWVLLRASARASRTDLTGTIEWWLGEGMEVPRQPQWDLATCLGGSWIFHGFEGTARALSARLRPGGRLAIGDLRLRKAADRESLQEAGAPEAATLTVGEQAAILTRLGLEVISEIVSPDEAWEGYHHAVIASADAYAQDHPDADYRHLAAAWMEDFQRDRLHLTWSVWIARKL
ncbi:MAG: methyltransferase domain-containing protein [Acidimicrobiia bacterium]|nr:methyltransferase domain-containing protein [Acidimicrobiia bacterium]